MQQAPSRQVGPKLHVMDHEAGDGVPVQRHRISDMPHGTATRHAEDVHLLDKNIEHTYTVVFRVD